jgi:site-specific DNA-methyltransferase (adenine-specific)
MSEIICGDCLDVMREMEDKSVDLVLTDPPYGIGAYSNGNMGGGVLAKQSQFKATDWDFEKPNRSYFDEIQRISKNQIIFGGNYFADILPASTCWIVWDKDNGQNNFADCELCWTSFKTAVRKYKFRWQGMLQEDMKHKEKRFHPTQKPVKLFEWLLKNYAKEGDVIFDPFAGSAAPLVACIRLGYQFMGVEKDPEYFRMAQERINKIKPQEKLFAFIGGGEQA